MDDNFFKTSACNRIPLIRCLLFHKYILYLLIKQEFNKKIEGKKKEMKNYIMPL